MKFNTTIVVVNNEELIQDIVSFFMGFPVGYMDFVSIRSK